MKFKAVCPYCDCENFEFNNKALETLICEDCGEISESDELNLKIIDEN